jgi:hypothetical protein
MRDDPRQSLFAAREHWIAPLLNLLQDFVHFRL